MAEKVKQIEIYKFANKKKRVSVLARVCAKIMNLSIKMKNHNAQRVPAVYSHCIEFILTNLSSDKDFNNAKCA